MEEDTATLEPAWPSAPQAVLDWVLQGRATTHDATADRTRGRLLEVTQIFGDAVVALRHVARGAEVRLGAGPESLEVPVEHLPTMTHTLFTPVGAGWECCIDPRWAGFVERDEARIPLDALLAAGGARTCADGLVRLAVPDDGRVVVDVGGVLFVAEAVYPSRRVLAPATEGIDHGMLATVAFMGFVAMVFGVALWRVPPPPTVTENTLDPHVVELWRDAQPKVAVRDPEPSAGSPAPKGAEGAAKNEPKKSLTKREQDKEIAENAGVLAAFADDERLASLGDASLPTALSEGVGSLIATRATQNGPGLGQRGPGLGGGGQADEMGSFGPRSRGPGGNSFSSGGVWAEKTQGTIRTPESGIVIGALDKALIDEVIKRNMAQIRYCYQRELNKEPTLGGKVGVRFVIAADGSVSSATTKNTTMNNPAVESCINGRFMRFTFPQPKGGGIVIVSYPFLFSPG